jgi:hypothetical protein
VVDVKRSAVSWILYFLLRPVMGVLIALITGRRTRRDRRKNGPAVQEPLQRELSGFALSRQLLLGKTILVESRLAEGSFRPDVRFAFD